MEYKLQFIAFGKTLWICVFALLYGIGGISKKWIRRFLGPLWMLGGVVLFSKIQGVFQWWILLYPVLLCASLHLGYGGTDNVWIKVRKRAIYGLALGVSAFPLCFNSHLWGLFFFHCCLCVVASIFYGVINPFRNNARAEETVLALFLTIIPMFLI